MSEADSSIQREAAWEAVYDAARSAESFSDFLSAVSEFQLMPAGNRLREMLDATRAEILAKYKEHHGGGQDD